MGMLVEGNWQTEEEALTSKSGKFIRKESQFRNWVTADGSSGFKAEPNRYHLYISLACPWACRALIFRKLKCLENVISLSIVDPLILNKGWVFSEGPGCIPDTVNGADYLYEVYAKADPNYTGRVTVPVLWDKKTNTIVNNESSEIIRMFNSAFNNYCDKNVDYYPSHLQKKIDEINEIVYHNINNGVYKCGFAKTQEAYNQAYLNLFDHLDHVDELLGRRRYLVGDQITEADWRLFTTLVRFDVVYVGHFNCNKKRIFDYVNLHPYLLELYQHPGIAETVNIDHIKQHYYRSHTSINSYGIVPLGPEINFNAAYDRSFPVLEKTE